MRASELYRTLMATTLLAWTLAKSIVFYKIKQRFDQEHNKIDLFYNSGIVAFINILAFIFVQMY